MRPAAIMQITIHPKLKELIGELADDRDLAMNELISEVFAKIVGRPDLAKIPRKQMGRPRKPVSKP